MLTFVPTFSSESVPKSFIFNAQEITSNLLLIERKRELF
jgi:hypothetical protein